MSVQIILLLALLSSGIGACSQARHPEFVEYESITSGAKNLLKSSTAKLDGKRIGIVANQSSVVDSEHLVDLLIKQGIQVVRIFSPEHGLRGEAEAGAQVEDGTDPKTGLPVVSLYGNHKKPTPDDLQGIEIMVFDLQDVGARFYTYISTLTYVMEACAENSIPLLVLDRPNPNGFYIDGPVLNPGFSSFVGLHPVPIVYGMTIGEYALMVNGEHWLTGDLVCDLEVMMLKGYQHSMIFELPVRPSPNLPNWRSVFLYPSLCLFEGTIMSAGRGTDYPFQIYGHPEYVTGSFFFVPESIPGVSLHPEFEGEGCYGQNLSGYARAIKNIHENPALTDLIRINLSWLIGSYELLSSGHDYFNDYFDTLAGTDELRKQIIRGNTENEIRESWEAGLTEFKKTRAKYLLYE